MSHFVFNDFARFIFINDAFSVFLFAIWGIVSNVSRFDRLEANKVAELVVFLTETWSVTMKRFTCLSCQIFSLGLGLMLILFCFRDKICIIPVKHGWMNENYFGLCLFGIHGIRSMAYEKQD